MGNSFEYRKIGDTCLVTDYVANGSFASLKSNVHYKNTPDYAILVRLTDFTKSWNGDYVYVPESSYKFLSKSKLVPGDLIMSNVGEPGKVFILPDLGQPTTLGPNSILIRPNNDYLLNKFVYYYFSSLNGKSQIDSISSATTQKKFNKTMFRELQIPTPPINIQNKTISALDQADSLRQKRKQAIDLLDEYLKSVFLEMFGDPVINTKKWALSKLDKVGTLERGKSKHRPRNAPELLGGKDPLIQTGDVANSNGYIKQYTQTYSEIGLKQSRMWPIGTLCITIAANIAKTGILTFEACFPDSVVGFTPNDKVLTEYVQFWFKFLQKILEDKAPESAQKNINLEILRNLEIPVPPVEQQNKFTQIVFGVEELKQKMMKQSEELDNQFNALMQKSFSIN